MKKLITILCVIAVLVTCIVCLIACGETQQYSITCQNAENGSVITDKATAQAGQKVILGARPNKGYRLTCFIVDGKETNETSFVMPEKDVAVSAKFEVITYNITYVLGDATLNGENPSSYTVESENTTLIAPQKDGYEICGWYTYYPQDYHPQEWYEINPEDYRVENLNELCSDVTLYARYYNPLHEITFDTVFLGESDYHGWIYIQDYVDRGRYGETFELTIEKDRGYELVNITVNGEEITGTTFTMPKGDAEIIATFKPTVYEITYVLYGGQNAESNPDSYTVEDSYLYFNSPEKDGCYFDGWYLDEDFNEQISDLPIDLYLRPLTLYAHFVEIENDYDYD